MNLSFNTIYYHTLKLKIVESAEFKPIVMTSHSFIKMLALIMRIHIQNRLRDHEREILSTKRKKDNMCGLTVNGLMRTLGTLMVIVSPGYVR